MDTKLAADWLREELSAGRLEPERSYQTRALLRAFRGRFASLRVTEAAFGRALKQALGEDCYDFNVVAGGIRGRGYRLPKAEDIQAIHLKENSRRAVKARVEQLRRERAGLLARHLARWLLAQVKTGKLRGGADHKTRDIMLFYVSFGNPPDDAYSLISARSIGAVLDSLLGVEARRPRHKGFRIPDAVALEWRLMDWLQ